jgi:pyruvate dehydrogenase E2 component (dihydrolipoamide acetyltransferase)
VPVGAPIARVGAGAGRLPEPPRPERIAAPGSAEPIVPAKATPLARRVARLHAVDLERVPGSGPRGRVTREDVLRFAGAEPQAPSQPAAAPAAVESAKGEHQRIEPSRLQQLVARRMAESKATIPHFQVQTEVVMDAALALRAGLKASANGAGVPSINDFIVERTLMTLTLSCDHRILYGADAARLLADVRTLLEQPLGLAL